MMQFGNIIGVLGIVVCLLGIVGRFYGESTFLGFQAINIFILGIGLMVLGCFAKLSGR